MRNQSGIARRNQRLFNQRAAWAFIAHSRPRRAQRPPMRDDKSKKMRAAGEGRAHLQYRPQPDLIAAAVALVVAVDVHVGDIAAIIDPAIEPKVGDLAVIAITLVGITLVAI